MAAPRPPAEPNRQSASRRDKANRLFDLDSQGAGIDALLTLRDMDCSHLAVVGRDMRHFGFHHLEDEQGIARLHAVACLDQDLPDISRNHRADLLGHHSPYSMLLSVQIVFNWRRNACASSTVIALKR